MPSPLPRMEKKKLPLSLPKTYCTPLQTAQTKMLKSVTTYWGPCLVCDGGEVEWAVRRGARGH